MLRTGIAIGVGLSVLLGSVSQAEGLRDFCSDAKLEISPGGGYVFARRQAHIAVARSDCLAGASADCDVVDVWNPAALARGQIHFGNDDRFLYAYGAGVDAGGKATRQGIVYKIDLRRALGGDAAGATEQFALPTRFDVLDAIDVAPPQAAAGWEAARQRLDRAGARQSSRSYNVRNLYGRISGDAFVYLYRRDDDYSVVYSRGGREAPLWPNGNAFAERMHNLDFRFAGSDAYVLAQGGVLRIGPKGLRDLTQGRSRAALVDGDDPAGFYGYWTAEGVVLQGVAARLRGHLTADLAAQSLADVTGVSLNNRSGASVVSAGPLLVGSGGKAALSYRHLYFRNGARREIDCDGREPARHEVVRIGGADPLFVERYRRPNATATVIFLYGGPSRFVNLANGLPDRILTFLDSGLDVDVVHYGGSGYTFDLSNRLMLRGPVSLDHDAKSIEAYVEATYPRDHKVSLYANSFGGLFYRHFSQAFLDRLDHRVLDGPAGSIAMRVDPIWVAINDQAWGRGTMARENAFFAGLTTCPLKAPTTLVVGQDDAIVNARDDYRLCGPDTLKVVEHPYGHMENPLLAVGGRLHSVVLLLARELGGAPLQETEPSR